VDQAVISPSSSTMTSASESENGFSASPQQQPFRRSTADGGVPLVASHASVVNGKTRHRSFTLSGNSKATTLALAAPLTMTVLSRHLSSSCLTPAAMAAVNGHAGQHAKTLHFASSQSTTSLRKAISSSTLIKSRSLGLLKHAANKVDHNQTPWSNDSGNTEYSGSSSDVDHALEDDDEDLVAVRESDDANEDEEEDEGTANGGESSSGELCAACARKGLLSMSSVWDSRGDTSSRVIAGAATPKKKTSSAANNGEVATKATAGSGEVTAEETQENSTAKGRQNGRDNVAPPSLEVTAAENGREKVGKTTDDQQFIRHISPPPIPGQEIKIKLLQGQKEARLPPERRPLEQQARGELGARQ